MDNSKIFNEIYPNLLSRVKPMDLSQKLSVLGIQKQGPLFILNFNDADALMPANAGFLYRDTAGIRFKKDRENTYRETTGHGGLLCCRFRKLRDILM